MQLPRFVVDTCENVEQAKQALLGAKQYDHGAPLCVTNHPLHLNPDPMNLPPDTEAGLQTFGRLRSLYERSKGATMSPADLRKSLGDVGPDRDLPFRTIWSTVFDTADRTLSTRLYLGDGPDGPRYTDEVVFTARRGTPA